MLHAFPGLIRDHTGSCQLVYRILGGMTTASAALGAACACIRKVKSGRQLQNTSSTEFQF